MMLRKAIFLTLALSAAAVWEGRAASHGSDEVPYVPPKSPVVREKLEWHHDDFWENCGIGTRTDRYPTYDTANNPETWAAANIIG